MKGYTKIELTDVNTGEKKVVEHKNMVTNAMSELAKTCNFLTAPIRSSFFEPSVGTAEALFGGIYLFENELNEDANDFILPADNRIVGYGCELSNNTVNTKMGSYNTSESGEQDDGSYKHVWDFATNQGNGEISAVALTPRKSAQAGFGVPFDEFATSLDYSADYYKFDRTVLSTNYSSTGLFVKDNYLYRIPYGNLVHDSSSSDKFVLNSQKIIIEKVRIIDNSFRLFDKCTTISKVDETIEVPLPSEFISWVNSLSGSSCYSWAQYDSGYIYVVVSKNQYVSSSGSFKLIRIKADDYSVEQITITNSTGQTMYYTGEYSDVGVNYRYAVVKNGKLIVNLYKGGKKFIVDINDSSNIKSIKKLGADVDYEDYLYLKGWFGSYILCVKTNSSGYNLYYINVEDSTCGRLNVRENSLWGFVTYYWGNGNVIPFLDDNIRHLAGEGSNGFYFGVNPFVLVTKNNLDTPVTKTSAQTMKITYILTENETA